jgi:SHS2 domain-containing protein
MSTSHVSSEIRRHRLVDHPGELELEIHAADLGGLLAEAACAVAGLLARELPDGGVRQERLLEVRSADREALLVDWLNELVYIAETELWVPRDVSVLEVSNMHVKATAVGVRVDRASSLVKAATHHRLRIDNVEGGLRATVVLDI